MSAFPTAITIYPPGTVSITVDTPPVVQLSIVEQLVTGAAGAVNDVLPGLGIDVTSSSGDYTVSVEFAPSGTSNATQAVRADDSRLSDARTPLAHTHAIADVTGLQAALDEALETMTKTVRKATAGTITKGQVVYIVGSTGSHLTVELADADTELTAATTIGVALNTITGTTDGEIIVQGYLDGLSNLPTSSFTDGQALWLSQTAGGWTNTRPTQPAHGVFLGWVISASNGSSGRAYIKVINGQELEELHDVLISSPADNDLLAYDLTSGLWKNQTAAQAGLAAATHTHAIADVTGLQTALDGKAALAHTHVIGDVTGLQTALDGKAPVDPSSVTIANNNTNSLFYPLFVSALGATTLWADVTTTPLTYNPSLGEMTLRRVRVGGTTTYIYFDGPASAMTFADATDLSSVGPAFYDHNGVSPYGISSNVGLVLTAPGITFAWTGGSYLFPASNGTNGQVLTTNGSGTLSWQTPAAASGASKAFAVAMAVAL